MREQKTRPQLTPKDRLCCVLALSEKQADAALCRARLGVSIDAVARRSGLDPETVRRLIASTGDLEGYRLNPNRLTRSQVDRIPGLARGRARSVLAGRPYYSMYEFESATGLDAEVLSQLVRFEPLEIVDATTGRVLRLEPVPGQYLVPPRDQFEDNDPAAGLGFTEGVAAPRAPMRLLVKGEFEAARPPHELKAAFEGLVHPVLRDDKGFLRYLVPGSLDLWLRPGLTSPRAAEILEALGLQVKASRPSVGFYQAELLQWPDDLDLTRAVLSKVAEASRHPDVVLAEPDQVGLEDLGPDYVVPAGDFEDVGGGPRGWNLDAIGVHAAHAMTLGRPEVTIFLIDSGLRLNHPDLKDVLRPDWGRLDLNFALGVAESETSPSETMVAHGTRVAGVAGGRASSVETGSRGVAPGCWLLPVKISGAPLLQSYGLRAAAIREAILQLGEGQRGVMNISWSTGGEHFGVREALIEASEHGFAIATSAGNYGADEVQAADTAHYPSGYAFLPGDTQADVVARRKIPGLCSVAAVDRRGAKASYSYYGARSVSFCAPGGEPGGAGLGIFLASSPENYAYGAGTSFAAPHVAGALALLFSLDPTLRAQRAVEILSETATDISAQNPSYMGLLGAGLINIAAALSRVKAAQPAGSATGGSRRGVSLPAEPRPDVPLMAGPSRVSINTAGVAELASLPLMGESTAHRIVIYREIHGPFASIWDLTRTGAIDRWTVEQIQGRITVDPGSAASLAAASSSSRPLTPANGAGSGGDGRLDINSATTEELAALPHLGEWTAERIVSYRTAHGRFTRIGDLTLTGVLDGWTIRQLEHLIDAG